MEFNTSLSYTARFSLWKPIKGPLIDWPLGLCDTRSVNFPQDTIAGDVVFDGFVTENLQVMHSPNFEWYYLPNHETWEALIFKSGDSEQGASPGMYCCYAGHVHCN